MLSDLLNHIAGTLSGSLIYLLKTFLVLLFLPWDYSFSGLHLRAALSLAIAFLLTDCWGAVSLDVVSVSVSILSGIIGGIILWSPFFMAEMLGDLADSLRGQNMAGFYDHNLQVSGNVTSGMLKYATLALIFQNNFTERFFYLLNFKFLPEQGVSELIHQLLLLLQQTFYYILPFTLAILSVQLLIIFLNKLSPQQSFLAESFVLQSILYVGFCYGLISQIQV